ncbi:MAG: hypothetical protein V4644_02160 [Patescibacteria group bacterium]
MAGSHKVGNITAGLMVALALLIDGVQFLLSLTVLLLPLSIFVTFIGFVTFGLWFALCGVNYMSGGGKKLLTGLAATVTELIPVINAVPATTLGVVAIIAQTRIEDAREHAGKKVSPRTAMAAARLQKMRAARSDRAAASREARENAEEARLAAANDNRPRSANDNASRDDTRSAA